MATLRAEKIRVGYRCILATILRFRRTGTWSYKRPTGRHKYLLLVAGRIINSAMHHNNELTAEQLQGLIERRFRRKRRNINISLTSIRRLRRQLGWVYGSTKYCQLIREENKPKRVSFCVSALRNPANLKHLVFTDECTVQLERYKRKSFHLKGEKALVLKSRAKHPVKVHVWAGISHFGATRICIFDGKTRMDSILFTRILSNFYLPYFLKQKAQKRPCILAMDNDPKHRSRYTRAWLKSKGIAKIRWPAESPDLNPIELVWHQLKEFCDEKSNL
jgi:transposase